MCKKSKGSIKIDRYLDTTRARAIWGVYGCFFFSCVGDGINGTNLGGLCLSCGSLGSSTHGVFGAFCKSDLYLTSVGGSRFKVCSLVESY